MTDLTFHQLTLTSLDSLVISDTHVGAENSLLKPLAELLRMVRDHEIRVKRLIINGDLVDSPDGRLREKTQWKIFRLISQISADTEVIWVRGNHDPESDDMAAILGATYAPEWKIHIAGRNILLVHGDRFDSYLTDHPYITAIADTIYLWVQKLDKSHRLARFLKRSSKQFVRAVDQVKTKACRYAAEKRFDVIICGHTHHSDWTVDGQLGVMIEYINTKCWTESPVNVTTIDLIGQIKNHSFDVTAAKKMKKLAA